MGTSCRCGNKASIHHARCGTTSSSRAEGDDGLCSKVHCHHHPLPLLPSNTGAGLLRARKIVEHSLPEEPALESQTDLHQRRSTSRYRLIPLKCRLEGNQRGHQRHNHLRPRQAVWLTTLHGFKGALGQDAAQGSSEPKPEAAFALHVRCALSPPAAQPAPESSVFVSHREPPSRAFRLRGLSDIADQSGQPSVLSVPEKPLQSIAGGSQEDRAIVA